MEAVATKFPSNPAHDTNCFHLAVEEWKRENDCPLADYNDLPLDIRSHIMRRANELKFAKKPVANPSPKTGFIQHNETNQGQAPEYLSMEWLNAPIEPGSIVRGIDYEEFMNGDL